MAHAEEMRDCIQRLHWECPSRTRIQLDPCLVLSSTNNFHLLKIDRPSGSAKVTFCEMVQWDFSSLFIFLNFLS